MARYAIMTVELVLRRRDKFEDNSFIEMKVWRVPEPVLPSEHRFKYSLVYIVEGKRSSAMTMSGEREITGISAIPRSRSTSRRWPTLLIDLSPRSRR